MQVIDLTHMVEAGMPQYPGSKDASFGKVARIEHDGYNETYLQFSCHTGTHIDCGRHFFFDGFDTGNTSPDRFYGKGVIINCCQPDHSMVIEKDWLSSFGSVLKETDFVLFYTGWDRYWGNEQYFSDYPVLDEAAARYLVTFPLKGVGIDALSFDLPDSPDFPVHRTLLTAGFVLIENLTQLKNLPGSEFNFSCFPLKIKEGDGSPVRAVGIVAQR